MLPASAVQKAAAQARFTLTFFKEARVHRSADCLPGLKRLSLRHHATSTSTAAEAATLFHFSPENFAHPERVWQSDVSPRIVDLEVTDVQSDLDLEGYGHLVDSPDDFTVKSGRFEIVKWPVSGWRQLDPHTGDEAGTTEGDFQVHWNGDFFRAKNLAINTINNAYLDGIGCSDPRLAQEEEPGYGAIEYAPENTLPSSGSSWTRGGDVIHLWMSDYHPDGGQLFFPYSTSEPFPFYMCLGRRELRDDVKPEQMRAFRIPPGKGAYIHPGTWHNGFYVHKKYTQGRDGVQPLRVFTRQGRVHARVSVSWLAEFGCLLRINMQE